MQTNTNTNADRVSARVSAKKIDAETWIYRGWIIKRWDNNFLNDPEIRGFQYNTYENDEAYRKSQMTDIARTLRDAKMYIDNCEVVK